MALSTAPAPDGAAAETAMSSSPRHAGESDGSMIRSEERLRAEAVRVPVGRAVLVKTIVTERKTFTVEVSHEEARLEYRELGEGRESDQGQNDGASGASFVLFEEQVVVTKRLVPIERVSLRIDTITEQRQVTTDLRHEEIEVTGDVRP